MENEIIPTFATYVGPDKDKVITIHETHQKMIQAFMATECPKAFIIFRHTTLDEVLSMDFQQAKTTELSRKEQNEQ
jgi:hypothetical protein